MSITYSDSEREFAHQMFVDFDEEVTHWRNNYADSRFYREGLDFCDFEASIKLGINAFLRSHGRTFNELRDQLTSTYERTRGVTPLDWSEASIAAEAAWDRMDARRASRIDHEASQDTSPPLPSSTRPGRRSPQTRPASPAMYFPSIPPAPSERHGDPEPHPPGSTRENGNNSQGKRHQNDIQDEALDETFPASDPVAPFIGPGLRTEKPQG